jgi:hypothetical protein
MLQSTRPVSISAQSDDSDRGIEELMLDTLPAQGATVSSASSSRKKDIGQTGEKAANNSRTRKNSYVDQDQVGNTENDEEE